DVAFSYQNTGTYGLFSSYLAVTLLDPNLLKFNITNFSSEIYTALEFLVQRGANSFYFGTANAQFDNDHGTFVLDPNEMAYQYVGDVLTRAQVPLLLNNLPATNRQALQALASAQSSTYVFLLIARLASPLQITPTLQPVLQALSVIGDGGTGVVASTDIRLIHTSDFLLLGGSNDAGDEVAVDSTISSLITNPLTMATNTVTIDTAMDIAVNSNGTPGDVVSVRSADLSILYNFGTDYSIVPAGRYRTYGLNILTNSFSLTHIATDVSGTVLTVTVPNNLDPGAQITFDNMGVATWLNGQMAFVATASASQFTAVIPAGYASYSADDTGNVIGQNIAPGAVVVVSYNRFLLEEEITYVPSELATLNGTVPTVLA